MFLIQARYCNGQHIDLKKCHFLSQNMHEMKKVFYQEITICIQEYPISSATSKSKSSYSVYYLHLVASAATAMTTSNIGRKQAVFSCFILLAFHIITIEYKMKIMRLCKTHKEQEHTVTLFHLHSQYRPFCAGCLAAAQTDRCCLTMPKRP